MFLVSSAGFLVAFHQSQFVQIPSPEAIDLLLKQRSMHAGQDRTNLRRGARADDSNGITGFSFIWGFYSQSLYGSNSLAPAIATPTGVNVCKIRMLLPCSASTSGNRL